MLKLASVKKRALQWRRIENKTMCQRVLLITVKMLLEQSGNMKEIPTGKQPPCHNLPVGTLMEWYVRYPD